MPQQPLPLVTETSTLLKSKVMGQVMLGFRTTNSTNEQALIWSREDAPEGAVVISDHQHAGRGRQGRTWDASAGLNLLFSIILYPTFTPELFGCITMASGLAVHDALRPFTAPLELAIKWPNDILLEGRKCCGMLLESALSPARNRVVLGIGLNVNQTEFPGPLAETATSLVLATGQRMSRAAILAGILSEFEWRYQQLQQGDFDSVRFDYLERLHMRNKNVSYRRTDGSETVSGLLAGVATNGALLLKTQRGMETFYAGELTTNLR